MWWRYNIINPQNNMKTLQLRIIQKWEKIREMGEDNLNLLKKENILSKIQTE